MMSKKEVKEALKKLDYTLINPSWYVGKDKTSVLFKAYDILGNVDSFYMDFSNEYAQRQALSDIMIHDRVDVSWWFFKNKEVR